MAEGIPVQKVVDMRGRGADNNKIIDSLRSEGFTFQQIRDAIQQADIKKSVGSPGTPIPPPTATPMPSTPIAVPKLPTPTIQTPSTPHAPVIPAKRGIDLDEIQRVLEEIIEEKWKESEKKLLKINEWKSAVNSKIRDFDTRLSELNKRVDALHTILGQKAEAFDETMRSVDTEIKALDRALNRIVPILSDNISELKGVVGELKK